MVVANLATQVVSVRIPVLAMNLRIAKIPVLVGALTDRKEFVSMYVLFHSSTAQYMLLTVD